MNKKDVLIKNGEKEFEYIVTMNGTEHTIAFDCDKYKKRYEVYVDGQPMNKNNEHSVFGMDQVVWLEGKRVHCVYTGKKVDIAVDCKYLLSKESYIPLNQYFIKEMVSCLLIIPFIIAIFWCAYIKKTGLGALLSLVGIIIAIIDAGCRDYLKYRVKKEESRLEKKGYQEVMDIEKRTVDVIEEKTSKTGIYLRLITAVVLLVTGAILIYLKISYFICMPIILISMLLARSIAVEGAKKRKRKERDICCYL